jgi:hypothetical protein
VIAIMRVSFEDDRRVQERLQERVRGKPFYLFLGANGDRIVRMKPQNLVSGLPVESVQ